MSSRDAAMPSQPSQPSASGASASASTPATSAVPATGSGANMRKRKNHRGGKKKRRKSFAVGAAHIGSIGDDEALHEDVEADPLRDTTQTAASARDDFYNVQSHHHGHMSHSHRPGSLSTSLESEALLLDHRDPPPFLRPRRPSLVIAPAASARLRVPSAGSDTDESAPLLAQSYHVGPRSPATASGPAASGDLPRPPSASARLPAFTSYGATTSTQNRPGIDRDLDLDLTNNAANKNAANDGRAVPDSLAHRSSSHTSLRRRFLNPFSAVAQPAYNVNYPPSVPGSPPLRPTDHQPDHNNLSFGDQMLRDELRASPSPSPSPPPLVRRSETSFSKNAGNRSSDALNKMLGGDREARAYDVSGTSVGAATGAGGVVGSVGDGGDGKLPRISVGGSGSGGGGAGGGAGAGSGGSPDNVCFPQDRLSEIGHGGGDGRDHADEDEDDEDLHDAAAAWRARTNRRRRGKWPDLAILDDWSRVEKEVRGERRRAKKIKEPQLVDGRLRPVHKGWHRAEEDAPYRFTYFNEEFQSTIHSQTISELVQPSGSFRELFIPDPPLLSDSDSEDGVYDGFDDDDLMAASTATFAPAATTATTAATAASAAATAAAAAAATAAAAVAPFGYDALDGVPTPAATGPPSTSASAYDRDSSSPYHLLPQLSRDQSGDTMSDDRPVPPPPGFFRSPPRVRSPQRSGCVARAVTPDLYPTRTRSPSATRAGLPRTADGNTGGMGPSSSRQSYSNLPHVGLGSGNGGGNGSGSGSGSGDAGNGTPQPVSQPSQLPQPPQLQPSTAPPKQPRYGERPVWWLDVLSPTEEEMKVLSKAFGIHPLTAEDIIMQEAREKVELFHHYYFVSYRSFDQDPSSETFLDPVNVYVVVFREGVLSFHFSMTPHPANVRRRIRQLSDYMILSSDWISYAIIDDITDVFVPLIQRIEDEVDDIDDAILQMHSGGGSSQSPSSSKRSGSIFGNLPAGSRGDDAGGGGSGSAAAATAESDTNMLLRVGDCRKRVMSLYRLLGNKADVIKGFAKRCNEHWEVAPRSEIGLYLGDIQDHIVTMTSNLGHYEKILSRAHGNYLAQINIRMNERQEQTADVLGKLTVLGTIVLPMNIITGLWGMNVWVPGQEYEGDLRWFMAITAGLLGFGVVCYWIAKRVYQIV